MNQELAAVSNFLTSYLPATETPSTFAEHLVATLQLRFAGHWHPNDPERGSAYRALIRTPVSIDQSIIKAAELAGLTRTEIETALAGAEGKVWLGDRWTLWIDPGCVSLRLERKDGSIHRDGQLIEIWGHLPESVKTHSVLLASFESSGAVERSVNISTPDVEPATLPSASPPAQQDSLLLSPAKKASRAIQILPPPRGRVVSGTAPFVASHSAATNSGVSTVPSSPAFERNMAKVLASPFVIPPTPIRPMIPNEDDVFSPTPATFTNSPAPSRHPSPLSADGPYSSLAPSPTGFPLFSRRVSSSSSVSSSRSATYSSDSEGSCSDTVFSSAESISSSVTSLGGDPSIWKSLGNDDSAFKYPRPSSRSSNHSSSSATSAFTFPAGLGHARSLSSKSSLQRLTVPSSPTKSVNGARSAPNSPSKPRRRGTRGGSGHSHSSSISSITSVGSTQSNATAASSTSTSRTREQAISGTVVEHSGGKVGVLGGGVLLGVAGGNKASSANSDSKRRVGRDRRRGPSQTRKDGSGGAVAPANLSLLFAGAPPYSSSARVWA